MWKVPCSSWEERLHGQCGRQTGEECKPLNTICVWKTWTDTRYMPNRGPETERGKLGAGVRVDPAAAGDGKISLGWSVERADRPTAFARGGRRARWCLGLGMRTLAIAGNRRHVVQATQRHWRLSGSSRSPVVVVVPVPARPVAVTATPGLPAAVDVAAVRALSPVPVPSSRVG